MKVQVIAVSLALAVPFFAGCSNRNDGSSMPDITFTLAPGESAPSPEGSLSPGEAEVPRSLSEEQAVVVSFLATLPNNMESAAGNSGTISVGKDIVMLTGVPLQKNISQQIPKDFTLLYGASKPGEKVGAKPVPLVKGNYYCLSASDPADPTRFFKSYLGEAGSLAALPDTVVLSDSPC